MGKPLTAFFAIAILLCAANTRAAVRTARIFSDHMVLQRELPVPIWGAADANKVVANGLSWLRSNQLPDGSWPALSLNRFHESSSDSERFMRDAATSFAVLALTTGGEFFSSTAGLP